MGKILPYKTESATKFILPVNPLLAEAWYTDLISSVVYDQIFTIEEVELSSPTTLSDSLNFNCSPTTNWPVVWYTFISLELTLETYPVAPLLIPLTLVPVGAEVPLEIWSLVYVWISKRWRSHSLLLSEYGASERA